MPAAKLQPAIASGEPELATRLCYRRHGNQRCGVYHPVERACPQQFGARSPAGKCAATAPAATDKNPPSADAMSHARVIGCAVFSLRAAHRRQASRRQRPPRQTRVRPMRVRRAPSICGAPDRQRSQRWPRQSLDIARRHEQAGVAGTHDFAAAGNVAGDDRTRASSRFEQRFRHAFAISRRQHGDRGAAPYGADIGNRAEPFDPGPSAPSDMSVSAVSERRLSGSVGPASRSSTSKPRPRRRRIAAAASSTPLSRSIRETSATVTVVASGSGSGRK